MADAVEEATSLTYNIVAVSIFIGMAGVFLFPCNRIIPLGTDSSVSRCLCYMFSYHEDRRTVAVLGATMCYTTRAFLFSNSNLNMTEAVDFDVLLLLASIMVCTSWYIDH